MLEEHIGGAFSIIGGLFTKIMSLLIVEQGVREETLLRFILINKTDGSRWLYDYSPNNKECSGTLWERSENEKKECKTFTDCIKQKLNTEGFIIRRLAFACLKEKEVEIWCVCTSPCLEQNKGKVLLERSFALFVDSLQRWFKVIEKQNRVLEDDDFEFKLDEIHNVENVTISILETSAREICKEIECLYFPLNISMIIGLSGEYYEKSECVSELVFLPWVENKEIRSINLVYDFRKSEKEESEILFIPENIRWIRKLLQMAQDKYDLCLVLQAGKNEYVYKVVGICEGKKVSELLSEKESVPWLRVMLKRHMHWELYLGKTYIFTFRSGNYKIEATLSSSELEERCKKVFGNKKSYSNVISAIQKCREQSHGTMLIVLKTNIAKKEVERLSDKQYGMQNAIPGRRLRFLNALNAIDGAIIMDINGNIHGVGMIVDGSAQSLGNMARGARYNSSAKYIDYLRGCNISGMILIVSEDGSVEIMDTT